MTIINMVGGGGTASKVQLVQYDNVGSKSISHGSWTYSTTQISTNSVAPSGATYLAYAEGGEVAVITGSVTSSLTYLTKGHYYINLPAVDCSGTLNQIGDILRVSCPKGKSFSGTCELTIASDNTTLTLYSSNTKSNITITGDDSTYSWSSTLSPTPTLNIVTSGNRDYIVNVYITSFSIEYF